MVGRGALDPVVEVQILLSQPRLSSHLAAPSSRGLGHGPLKAETRVRIPLGPPQSGVLFAAALAGPLINLSMVSAPRNL